MMSWKPSKEATRKIVAAAAMDEAECVTDVPFADKSNQHSDDELMIGFMTKQSLQKLKDEVKPREIRKLYIGAQELFVGAALYITQKFVWDDPVLKHVCFVYFEKRSHFF